jgi:hypothetical protein
LNNGLPHTGFWSGPTLDPLMLVRRSGGYCECRTLTVLEAKASQCEDGMDQLS